MLAKKGGRSVAVGYDGRLSSPKLEAALVGGLAESGIDVVRIGLGPTPMLYYAVFTLQVDGGLMITGSHNPANYNGFKMMTGKKSFFGRDIQELGKVAAAGDFRSGAGKVTEQRVFEDYVARLLQDYDGKRKLKVAWDAGNGATGAALVALVKGLPGEHILLNETIDGTFPAHHPDPTEPKNLVQLQEAVRDKGCDFGIAFDGDGDRIGVIDGKGRILWGDQLMVLLGEDRPQDQARRDDHRRRQGEPGAVRRDQADGRRAADVAHRPFADQDQDGRDRRAARRRDERPYLLRRPLLRLRRRALCRGPAARHRGPRHGQRRRAARPPAERRQYAGAALPVR